MPENFERQPEPQPPDNSEADILKAEGEIPIEAKLRKKESDLLDGFKDYLHVMGALEESFDRNLWQASTFAIALADKDPAMAKLTAQRFIAISDFAKAAEIALAIGDRELEKKILEECPKKEIPDSVAEIAANLGDIEPMKENLKRWAQQNYYPSPDEVGKMALAVANKDPNFVKELIDERSLESKTSHLRSGVESSIVALSKADPIYGRDLMEKLLNSRHNNDLAGKIAVELGDRDSAKQAAENCLAVYRPDQASDIALAIGDRELAQKVIEVSEIYGARGAGVRADIYLALGDIDSAKKSIEESYQYAKATGQVTDEKWDLERVANLAKQDPASGKQLMKQHLDNSNIELAKSIALALADKDPASAREAARRFSDMDKQFISDRIVVELFEKNTSKLQISPDEAAKLLALGKDKTALAVGWFLAPDDLHKSLEKISNENIRRSALLGEMFNKRPEMYQRELVDIAFSSPDDPRFGRTLARCLVYFDYEQVSNIMLQKVKSAQDEKILARYLKTLIEIENPKGRTIATDLFTNREVSPHLRTYLARKLIAEKHWDPELGPLLQKAFQEGRGKEIDNTLVAMIKDLGLTPDKPGYEALEKPGLLLGVTLQERVQELKSLRQEFSQLPLDQLKERLRDERIRQVFYLVKGGEYRYTLINDYSYEKFSLVVGKITGAAVDEGKIREFENSLEAAGIAAEQRQYILQSFREGRFPLENPEQRSVVFETSVELGSEYEIAFQRLQEIWGRELKTLAVISEQHGELPLGMDTALTTLEGVELAKPKVQKIIEFLKQGEKQDYQSIKKIAEACKKDLISSVRQKAKQSPDKQGVKENIAELERLNISGILHAFLSERLPQLKDSAVLSEWESHLREALSTLEAGPAKGGSRNKRLELTFLDKGRDFVRAVRFADGRQCCFNSSNYRPEAGLGADDWISRLHADPLSFIMDVKEQDSRIISGFVFGRMGIDPETTRPVVMLNGIYSQESGGAVANNILKSVEDNFARRIGASSIVIASKHGGTLSQKPSGYEQVKRELRAIRALENSDRVYDDIGNTPNGTFTFEGYERKLS